MNAAIDIRGVHKRFGKVTALAGVEFRIEQGEFFGLLGPNGAGKSTLIGIIAGLIRADLGHVSVLGYDVVREYRHARAAIGVVPQEIVFDAFFTVREMLQIQAGYYGLGAEVRPWIDELLHELSLADKADAYTRTLSGGMKRRVMMAQALVHRPPVIILDEPTAGVDVELRQSLWKFIRALHRQGHTIVLTTHYLEEAESLCQRIGIISQGNLVALDDKESLLCRSVGSTATLVLTLDRPLPHDIPAELAGRIRHYDGTQLVLGYRRGEEAVSVVLETLQGTGVTVMDLRTEEADLEDVFIELTRSTPI